MISRTPFSAPLSLGRSNERSYLNSDGATERWALVGIISLDALGDLLTDGVEVYSEPVELEADASFAFETVFHPELTEPTQTV